MTFVFFLLGVLYVALIVALLASGANGVTVAFIAGGLALFQLFGSDKLALHAMGAREVTPQTIQDSNDVRLPLLSAE